MDRTRGVDIDVFTSRDVPEMQPDTLRELRRQCRVVKEARKH